jgi:hypothetical protein
MAIFELQYWRKERKRIRGAVCQFTEMGGGGERGVIGSSKDGLEMILCCRNKGRKMGKHGW